MEFDHDPSVSDEQRRLAEAKRITVRPIHTTIEPDPIPDAEIVARHASDPPIGNLTIDTEQNRRPLSPSRSALKDLEASDSQRTGAIVITIVIAITIVGIAAASLFLVKR